MNLKDGKRPGGLFWISVGVLLISFVLPIDDEKTGWHGFVESFRGLEEAYSGHAILFLLLLVKTTANVSLLLTWVVFWIPGRFALWTAGGALLFSMLFLYLVRGGVLSLGVLAIGTLLWVASNCLLFIAAIRAMGSKATTARHGQ